MSRYLHFIAFIIASCRSLGDATLHILHLQRDRQEVEKTFTGDRGQEYIGPGIPIYEDNEKIYSGLGMLLTAVPNDARYYEVSIDQSGNLNKSDLERAVESATMIEISLDGSL